MQADAGERLSGNIGSAQRVELQAANTELLRLDLRISRLETVLKLLLAESSSAKENPTVRWVEPHRAPC
jgi:hypothetical protein